MDSLKLKFTSSNGVPVTEARITRQEYEDIKDTVNVLNGAVRGRNRRVILLEENIKQLRSYIDRLMLEYCPEDMTKEQMEEWGKNQVPVTLTAETY